MMESHQTGLDHRYHKLTWRTDVQESQDEREVDTKTRETLSQLIWVDYGSAVRQHNGAVVNAGSSDQASALGSLLHDRCLSG